MPRLGVLGTMVWDTIHAHDGEADGPVEDWGGISYALAAADAALQGDWTVFPILKVGRDMREEADAYLSGLERVDSLDGVRSVAERNNRVELFYHDTSRRCEKLTGGVPGWTAEEIAPLARSCDALYVNFIAGWELDLEASAVLRDSVGGPVYCDIHSLLLGVGPDGVRRLRPLDDWRAWLRCFDIVQLNEDELASLDGRDDPWSLTPEALGADTRALLVTLGGRGAAWVATTGIRAAPIGPGPVVAPPSGSIARGEVEVESLVADADPTGCGDVWGGTCFAALLRGADLENAMREANRAAARSAGHRGAGGLSGHLRAAPAGDAGRAGSVS